MREAVEIHDSRLVGVSRVGRDLVLHLAPAYVHRSEGRPGVDPGTGWLVDLDLMVLEVVVESLPSNYPVNLADGDFRAGERRWDNLIPLPLDVAGAVSLDAIAAESEPLVVRGSGARIVVRQVAEAESVLGDDIVYKSRKCWPRAAESRGPWRMESLGSLLRLHARRNPSDG